MKHCDSIKTHFRRRWIERATPPYNTKIPASFKRQVLNGEAIPVDKRGDNLVAICKFKKKNYDIVYNKKQAVCVTVLREF